MIKVEWTEAIKHLAKQQGVPLSELAIRLHMTESGLHLALKRKTLKVDALLEVCRIFRVSMNYFFDGSLQVQNPQPSNKVLTESDRLERLENEVMKLKQIIEKAKNLNKL